METAKYVIVGGGAAGFTAATTIRKLDGDSRIVLIAEEEHALYTRKSLPSFVEGHSSKDQLFLRTATHYQSQHIEIWAPLRATGLDVDDKVLTLSDGRRITYQKLLLAGGSKPRHWHVPGSHLDGVLPMRTLEQAETIAKRIAKAKHIVLIGGGFITLGHIQALAAAGVATTVVIREPYYWSGVLDEESGLLLQSFIDKAENVRVLYQTAVEHVEGDGRVEGVLLSNGKRLPTDLLLTNIGVDPDIAWLQHTPLRQNGGIEVDAFLRTSYDSIWAAGDIALFDDTLLGARHRLGNWDNAVGHGEVAGHNMVSDQPKPFESLTTYSTSFFGTNISFVGDFHHHARMTVIPRGSARSGHYARLLLHDGRLVGATLINLFAERQPIEQLIRHRVAITKQTMLDLTDETVSLRDIVKRLIP